MSRLRQTIYKLGWDTRCRGLDTAQVLKSISRNGDTILDVGCGEYGLTAFMPGAQITGVDILAPETVNDGVRYVHGSIMELPFDDGSFDVAASVDVLEHLPGGLRAVAIHQIVRVARKAVVITFPSGRVARHTDEHYRRELDSRGMERPEWLDEHLSHPYPDSGDIQNQIRDAAERLARRVELSIQYSESSAVARRLRWAAARTRYGYMAANLLTGIMRPLIPAPSADTAYRAIVVAKFVD